MPAPRPRRSWRRACVVRAQTGGAGVRLVDLAIEPAFPEFEPGAVLDFIVDESPVVSIHTYVSMPIGPGLVRICIPRCDERRHGMRFWWSLVEGATVNLSSRAPSGSVARGRPRDMAAPARGAAARASVLQMRVKEHGTNANPTP